MQKLLCFGAVSLEIIEAVYKYSHKKRVPLGLACNPQKIIHKNPTFLYTRELTDLCDKFKKENPNSKVYLYRTNCGPGNFEKTVTRDCIRNDLENGFDYIHLDVSKIQLDRQLRLDTLTNFVDLAHSIKSDVNIDIGIDLPSDQNEPNLDTIEYDIKYILSMFSILPSSYITNIGLFTQECYQIGKPNLKRATDLYQTLGEIGLKSYNTEFVGNSSVFRKYTKYLSGLTIKNQAGIVQTSYLLSQCQIYGIVPKKFYEFMYKKWSIAYPAVKTNGINWMTTLLGHHEFGTSEYKQLFDMLEKKNPNLKNEIIREVFKVIDFYYKMLN